MPTREAMTRALNGSGLGVTVDSALALLVHRSGLQCALVTLKDGDDQFIVALQGTSPSNRLHKGASVPWSQSLCALLQDGDPPLQVGEVTAHPAYAHVAAQYPGIVSYAGALLRAQDGSLLGSLCLIGDRAAEDGAVVDEKLLTTVASLLEDLVNREVSNQQTAERAEVAGREAREDDLTGLLNRRGWRQALDEVERRCADEGLGAVVVCLDLDGLKAVNDREGHDAGDALLRRAAAALHDAAPALGGVQDAILARLGGDEFAVLLVGASPPPAPAAAGALLAALAEAGVSAGAGAAEMHQMGGLVAAFREADRIMIADKRMRPAKPALPVIQTPLPRRLEENIDDEIVRLLNGAREIFGLDAAFVSQLSDNLQTFTHIAGDMPLGVGDTRPAEITLCHRVMAGRLPAVITDATQYDECSSLDVVVGGLIRTYLTVPVFLDDGTLFGSLCCFSAQVREDLTQDASAALRFAAHEVGLLLSRKLRTERRTRRVERAMADLLGAGGLRIALQPVIGLTNHDTLGYEALARFGDGRSPSVWFSEVADEGLSERLEIAAFDLAVSEGGGQVGPPAFLAVNLSPATLLSEQLHQRLADLQSRRPEMLAHLIIELTEHHQVLDYDVLVSALRPWRDLGMRVAVDDTGAGHSSLSHVLQLRPDIVKLDRRLITDIDRDDVRQALVASLVQFCGRMGADLVAEGVESQAELDALVTLGVPQGQGFLLGRPRLASTTLAPGAMSRVPRPRPAVDLPAWTGA